MIDHRERNEVNVHTLAKTGDAQRTKGDTFSIDKNQSLFGKQTAQVDLYTTIVRRRADHLSGGPACFLRKKSSQVL